ncbi:blast:Alpha-tocopherol transfer protein-like [Drosophila guanche]|uniref:Blast:Alpha-tocopherol transfer protein-like n=1 Tax=Drosophila guanche TaxID=7266 RepID=A0A3B0J0B9_DROGU|nr:blast:Alpha-tocopherol transfer protein-like [Drosophila guanche]
MSKAIKYYYDFLSQPSRALWIEMKLGKTPFDECPVALRKREQLTDEYKNINRFQKGIRVPCGLFFRSVWLYPVNGVAPMPKTEQIQKLVKDVETNLGLVERLWLEKDFLIGDQLTVADIFGASEINQMKLCQYNVSQKQFPKIAKWLARVRESSNPYFDEAHNFVYEKSKQAVSAKV